MSRSIARVAAAGLMLALTSLACGKDEATNPSSSKELDSPALLGATAGSQNYTHTFSHEGTFPYHCRYHTTSHHRMAGTVTVSASGPESVFVSITIGAFQPQNATVRAGGRVRWQNFDDGVHHTVTSD